MDPASGHLVPMSRDVVIKSKGFTRFALFWVPVSQTSRPYNLNAMHNGNPRPG